LVAKALLEDLRTSTKSNELVLGPSYKAGAFDSHAVDCPFPFRSDGQNYMTYVGWDTIGYRTGLASSSDLLHWNKEGLILDRGSKGSPTEFNVALTCIMRDNELYGSGELISIGGRFVGTYHTYPRPGYETGPGAIGLCYGKGLCGWDVAEPILIAEHGAEWERGGLYKSWLMEYDGTYYLFYNAKDMANGDWVEQIGLATSPDLIHWERYSSNPILGIGAKGSFDEVFVSDPCVFFHKDTWVMFYYGLSRDGHARDSVAFSRDLYHWEKSNEILIDVGEPGSVDSLHAHKPGMIAEGGCLYHFCCAVSPANLRMMGDIEHHEVRGISLARSC
jgi:predicted GH43/DUF377 family glycosyl hydrolase